MAPKIVSVWTVDLDQPLAAVDILRGYLDDTELRAAAARSNDTVRNRYVVADGALRSILGARLAAAPGAVVIARRCSRCGDPAHGKPELVDSRADAYGGVSFSLSHSESVAVVALATGTRLGVDVEVVRPRRHLDALAARVLGAEAHADWLDVEPTGRLRAFLEQWTAKEAYLKAIGAGITMPLRDVPAEPVGWTVAGFDAAPGTVAAVAVEGDAQVQLQLQAWVPPAVESSLASQGNRPIDKFRDTAVGSVLAAGLLGLRDVIEPVKDEKVAIVKDYAGDPPFSDPFVLRLDPDHPEDSIVMVRPWLRNPPPPNPPPPNPDEPA